MTKLTWRRWLKGLAHAPRERNLPAPPRRAARLLAAEALEDRLTPAANLQLIDALQFGDELSNFEEIRSVAVDADGNTYVTGYFNGTTDFDPGPSTFNLSSNGSEDAFLVKLDAADNFVYAARFGGTDSDIAWDVATDANGNAYVSGRFYGTADFDPGAGTFNLTATNNHDAFLVKLDSGGGLVYAAQFGNANNYEEGSGVAADSNGNAYVVGYFYGTADFDPGAGTFNLTAPNGNGDAFLVKLDAGGNFVSATQFGGTDFQRANDVTTDSEGNLYVVGQFRGTTDFDPGAGTFDLTSTSGSEDVFLVKLDSGGNFVYADRFGGTSFEYANRVAADSEGNAYVVGHFYGTADFDPGAGTFDLTPPNGNSDAFVVKVGADGNFVYAAQFGGTNYDEASGVAVDSEGNAFVTGRFFNTADFDPGSGTFNLTAIGDYDGFLVKLAPDGSFLGAINFGGPSYDVSNAVAADAAGTAVVGGLFYRRADFDPGSATAVLTSDDFNHDAFVAKYGDLTFSISASDPSATETTSPAGADPGRFTVTRSYAGQFSRTITYAVSGTATSGADYATLTGTVTFGPGSTTAFIDVAPINDTDTEGDETVTVTLDPNPDSYSLGTAGAMVTITDNEPEVSVTAPDEFASETAAPGAPDVGRFRISRTGDTSAPLTVSYTLSGAAINGTDYATLSGSVVIPAGQSSALVTVTAVNDALIEGDEAVTLTLAAGSYTVVTPTAATVTIFDNEPEVRLFAADASATEGTADDGRFTVTRTGSTASPLTVLYTVSGSAANGADYASLSGGVTIPAGQSSADIVIDALADANGDAGETVVLTLDADPTYTVAGPFSGQVTIAEPAASAPPPTLPAPPQPLPPAPPTPATPSLASAVAGPNGGFVAYNSDGTVRFARTAYAGFAGRVTIAVGDVDRDGTLDVITGTGAGATHVKAFSGIDGTEIRSFLAFGGFGGGVNLGSGDLDGDGFADILVGTAAGSSHVKAFSGATGAEIRSFFAFEGFTGGVTVAGGDLDGDTLADVVVGSASGASHVKAFSGLGGGLLASFFAGASNGVYVGAGDLDGDGRAEVVTGAASGGSAVRVFSGAGQAEVAALTPFGGFGGGAFVAVGDRDGDGDREIIVGAGPGAGPHVVAFRFPELDPVASFFAFDPGFRGGVPVG
jgi:hypothetical protein